MISKRTKVDCIECRRASKPRSPMIIKELDVNNDVTIITECIECGHEEEYAEHVYDGNYWRTTKHGKWWPEIQRKRNEERRAKFWENYRCLKKMRKEKPLEYAQIFIRRRTQKDYNKRLLEAAHPLTVLDRFAKE